MTAHCTLPARLLCSCLAKHNTAALLDAIVSIDVLAGCYPERPLWHISCYLTENLHAVIVMFLVPKRVFITTVSCILLGCVGVRATGEAGS